MFKNLRIKNFRSIKDSGDLELSNLNIIVGPNNSGKSSILYPILLLKQTYEDKDLDAALVTSGPHVDLGSYIDIVNANEIEKSLEINFEFDRLTLRVPPFEIFKPAENIFKGFNKFQIKFKLDKEKNKINVSAFNLSNSKTKISYGGEYRNGKWILSGISEEISSHIRIIFYHFMPGFYSFGKKPKDNRIVDKTISLNLSSMTFNAALNFIFDRILYVGPIRQLIPRYGFVGTKYYSELTPSGQDLIRLISSNTKLFERSKKILLNELNYWLDKKFRTLENIRISYIDPSRTIMSILADDPRGDKNINLASMGSGLSQLVPVIVQTVLTPKKGCIIIEQPEIHLHPAAQATLGDLFVNFAKDNKQIIVETHSEHLLLRVRRRVAEGKISPELVSIFFVDKSKNETRIRKLNLQKNGHFKSWPAGFFEGGYHDAMKLVMAQSEDKTK